MSTDMSVYGLFAEPRELCELLHGEEPVQRFKIVECIHVFLILAFSPNPVARGAERQAAVELVFPEF
jgi:hypothetical protein